MNLDEIKYSLQNLIQRRMRSFLSVLSILIGVMAIFAIVSFGLGIKNYMDVLAQEAGTDKLMLMAKGVGAPGTDETFFIPIEEIDFVGKIKGVKEISGMYFKVAEIEFKDEKKFNYVIGMDMENIDFVLESFAIDIVKGRQLKKGESNKVALGYNHQFENKFFKKAVKLGDKIEINSIKFEVVGFYEEVGNPQDDSQLYLTFEGFEALFPDDKDEFGYAMLQAEKGVNPEELADKIQEKLRKYKSEEEGKETFYVQTFADMMETFATIINVLNGILALIALVSMIVASVNIMNTMYTSVLERTREIGIMKAIGAKNRDIGFIFIFEAGFLGAVGGIVGVILGYAVASLGGYMAAQAGYSMLQPIFPLYLVIGCILFAFLVGAGAGIMPAWNASKLNPVDALRYE